VQCIHQLFEGCSLRSTERLTGIDINTIMKLLVVVGTKCEQLLDERIAGVPVKDVECDEIWCFVSMKEKTLKSKITEGQYQDDFEMAEKLGDAYTFVGFERNSKLVLAWHLGRRTSEDTLRFAMK